VELNLGDCWAIGVDWAEMYVSVSELAVVLLDVSPNEQLLAEGL